MSARNETGTETGTNDTNVVPLSAKEGHLDMPSPAQRAWLRRGIKQPGGKLPLFDTEGQQVCERTVRACITKGWAEPWFSNPLKPNWIVCKLTEAGRLAIAS